MDNGDPMPPILYNSSVLRKAKQQEMDRRLELEHSDPILNLTLAKYESLAGIIRNIGHDPFFCMYWTEEQQLLYKTVMKQNSTSFLTINATGSFAKKLKLISKEKSPHIYLYQCVAATDTNSTPVFQMVSTKQDATIITYFFLCILAVGAPSPRMIAIDFSKALLMAVAKTFANCADTRDYLQVLYNIIILKKQEKLPTCYIRLDVSHFMATIAKWDCLRGKVAKVRQFYLRIIAHVYKMGNIQDIQNILTSIMIVALSEDIGCNDNYEILTSESHFRSINDVIKGISIEDPADETEIDEEVACSDLEYSTGWTEWAKSIYESAKTIAATATSGSIVNAFYNPQVAEKLRNLISYLPLWTAVMRPYFHCDKEVATSSATESAFAELKNRVFKSELPMRIDKFVIRHVDWLKGKTLLSLANENMNRKECDEVEENCIKDKSIEQSENVMWNMVENWRGLTTKNKSSNDEFDVDKKEKKIKKKKLTYLDYCPEWDHMTTLKRIALPLLQNGSLLKASRCGTHFIVLRETCAFDTLAQIMANAIATNENYAAIATEQNNNFCNFAKNICNINSKNITTDIYQERAKILCNVPIFKKEPYRADVLRLNANCNVAHLAEHLLADFPSLIINKKCQHCNHENIRKISVLTINVNLLLQAGLSEINNAILDTNSERNSTCTQCHETVVEKYNFMSHLLVDCSVFTDDKYAASIGIEKKIATLDSVPKHFELNEQEYLVTGVTSYRQYASKENDGHYTAYIYDTTRWYVYDDMVKKRRATSNDEEIAPHLLVYIARNMNN